MALNASDASDPNYTVPGFHYQFWQTWAVSQGNTPAKIAGWVAITAVGAPGGKYKSLILNGHGYYGKGRYTPVASNSSGGFGLGIGTGIMQKDLHHFSIWKGLIDEIHIPACGIGRMSNLGGPGDGQRYCWMLAQQSGAIVYAPIISQFVEVATLPYSTIDDYEGTVIAFYPDDRAPAVWRIFPNRGITI